MKIKFKRKISLKIFKTFIYRWQSDALCGEMPYPKVFDEFRKTLSNIRKFKYGKSPTNGLEVLSEFEKPHVSEQYGVSLLAEHGPFFYDVIITDNFENCIFASSKSIELVLHNTNEVERFFVLDGTFRITPNGIWQQVLILHISFGHKVSITLRNFF